jgi:hypothetical protein
MRLLRRLRRLLRNLRRRLRNRCPTNGCWC